MSEALPKRRTSRLPPERRIADIMGAAREVFAEKGYQEALISDIAERAGIVEGSIYRFFANKRDLLQRVAEDWFERMLADDEAQFAAIAGARNRLRFIVHQHLTTVKREPALSRLVFRELRPQPDYRGSRLFQLNRRYTRRLVEVIADAVARGEYRDGIAPTLVRDMIYGGIEHHTWAFLRGEGDFEVDATADGIAELVHRGLLAAPEPPEEQGLALVAARLERAVARLERQAPPGPADA